MNHLANLESIVHDIAAAAFGADTYEMLGRPAVRRFFKKQPALAADLAARIVQAVKEGKLEPTPSVPVQPPATPPLPVEAPKV